MSAKETAIEKMNRYGRESVPFLFVIDYEMKRPEVIPVAEISPEEILFDIRGFNNNPMNHPEPTEVRFSKQPVSFPVFRKAYDVAVSYTHLDVYKRQVL